MPSGVTYMAHNKWLKIVDSPEYTIARDINAIFRSTKVRILSRIPEGVDVEFVVLGVGNGFDGYSILETIKTNEQLTEIFHFVNNEANGGIIVFEDIDSMTNIVLERTENIVNNELTLIEHLTPVSKDKEAVKNDTLEEFKSYDKGLRILTYKILLEKFNSKYSELNERQKYVLKEFINSIDSTPHLREFYNNEIKFIKTKLKESIEKTNDQTIKIKLNEVYKLIGELNKNHVVKNDDLVNLLQYHELLEELNKTK
jgi:hypothetical protein